MIARPGAERIADANPLARSHPLVAASVRQLGAWLALHRERLLLTTILTVSAAAHGINMFQFPYYENDEGTYISQAWSILAQNDIAPYTYWYDHAPGGWIQLAAWAALTGGFYTFGTAIDSGRAAMLLFQVGSTYLLYRIARAISQSLLVPTIAALSFALSPYGIYFHRRVLLDNITTFWMLLSVALLLSGRQSLVRVWLSALALGISILSKELTIFVAPALLYLVFTRTHREARLFATVTWLVIVLSMFSLWPLMALIKSELLPAGWLGQSGEHVSLVDTIRYQMSRGRDGGLLQLDSGFWRLVRFWVVDDPFLVVFGSAGAILSTLAIIRSRIVGSLGFATLSLWCFLARGGEVIGFYLVPLLPLLALHVGLIFGTPAAALARRLRKLGRGGRAAAMGVAPVTIGLCLGLFVPGYSSPNLGLASNGLALWQASQTSAQRDAMAWVQRYVSPTQIVAVEDFMWTDLHAPPAGGRGHELAHWYWKVDKDPEIRDRLLGGDWRKLDYLVGTPQMWGDIQNAVPRLELLGTAAEHATTVARFDSGGWPVDVRRVDKLHRMAATADPLLQAMWAEYRARFIHDGRVVDPSANGQTTSEGQAYALLRAVYMDDRPTFEQVWQWTRTHLQVRPEDALFSWQWGARPDGRQGILDASSAADADEDMALALLLAAQRWEADYYRAEALKILRSIWQEETTLVAGRRVLVAGSWARGDAAEGSAAVLNPSYLAPYAYRIFAEADPARPWMELVDSSYSLLEQLQASPELGGPAGLVPNWVAVDVQTGELRPADGMGPTASLFSYDASRVAWRLAVDWLWFGEARARTALERLSLPREQIEHQGRLLAAYGPDGQARAEYEAISMYAGALGSLLAGGDQELACRVFAEKVLRPFVDRSPGHPRADPNNYYDANWAWFATALVDGGMANLWIGETTIDWDARLSRPAPGGR